MNPEPYKFYMVTPQIRRGPEWHVKPECESLDGKRVLVSTGWKIDDIPMYQGEYAMLIEDGQAEDMPVTWIASGDLTDWAEAERPD